MISNKTDNCEICRIWSLAIIHRIIPHKRKLNVSKVFNFKDYCLAIDFLRRKKTEFILKANNCIIISVEKKLLF